ncbi:unnamed protein product [Bursaphelenchus okinawaensis]|uniref:Protein regulator of cytokinesis 1 n=1 Tax=Bursaphelenchus okinawaensis TaxID=465554 RepID=A0A811KTF6_9BILA|nr:unnamed protein product [Bursaphelenchus okinawaensis]CAG9112328.1 unnamed protein product [Bursaphelenchus okinawaensis]
MDGNRRRTSIMISPTNSPVRSRAGKRRMSVDDSTANLLSTFHTAMETLNSLWNKVHLDQPARELRIQAAHEHFYSLMEDIVESEKEMVKGVETDIKTALAMNNDIRQELHEQSFRTQDFKPMSVSLLKALRKDLEKLKTIKDKKMAKQLNIYDELTQICTVLDEEVPFFDGVEDKILSPDVVEEITELKNQKKLEFEERLELLTALQNKANKMNQVVKNISLDELEKELLSLDFTSRHRVPLSQSFAQRFEDLLEKFDHEYQKWLEAMEFEYIEMYGKLKELALKCHALDILDCHESEFDPDRHAEDEINRMRVDLDRLQTQYETGKEVYDKFFGWYNAFEEMGELELDMQTEAYRKNRGGCLNRALQKQKVLKAKQQKFLEQLKDINELPPSVTINGLSVYEFVVNMIEEKDMLKENAKVIKKRTREEQIKYEQRFGTSSTPPGTSSPRKRVQTPSTAVLKSKKRRSSSVSVIEPISASRVPVASSPKPAFATPSRTPSRLIPPKEFRSARR